MIVRKYLFPVPVIVMMMAFFSCTPKPAEYYPLKEGNKWTVLSTIDIVGGPNNGFHISIPIETFVLGEELVDGMETIKVGGLPPNDDYFCWRIDLQGLKLCKLYRPMNKRYAIYKPPLLVFPSMFNVGNTLKKSSSFSVYSADDDTLVDTYTGNTTVTFESIEDINVYAGPFEKCVKLSGAGTYDRSSGGTFEESSTVWYAKNVGMVKETLVQTSTYLDEEDIEATITNELVSATVNGVTYE